MPSNCACPCCVVYGPVKQPEDEVDVAGLARRQLYVAFAAAERGVVLAYLRDRQAQYDQWSGIAAALGELIADIEQGEHVAAMKHGELDDLIRHVTEGSDE